MVPQSAAASGQSAFEVLPTHFHCPPTHDGQYTCPSQASMHSDPEGMASHVAGPSVAASCPTTGSVAGSDEPLQAPIHTTPATPSKRKPKRVAIGMI
jgi:hypothetical protein